MQGQCQFDDDGDQMTKEPKAQSVQRGFPGCAHPSLRPFADSFLAALATDDPIKAATRLGDMSRGLKNGAKRRQNLAARIALIGLAPTESLQEELSQDTVEQAASAIVEQSESVDVGDDVKAVSRKQKTRKLTPPKILLNDAASLLASLDSASGAADLSNPDDFLPGTGMSLSAPVDGELGKNSGDLSMPDFNGFGRDSVEWPDDPAPGERRMRTWPEDDDATDPNDAAARTLDETAPAPVVHTATDLSLAILTGEFRRPNPAPSSEPEALEDDDTNDTDQIPQADPISTEDPEITGTARARRADKSRILKDDDASEATLADPEAPLAGMAVGARKTGRKKKRLASDMSALSSLMQKDNPSEGQPELSAGRLVDEDEAANFAASTPPKSAPETPKEGED